MGATKILLIDDSQGFAESTQLILSDDPVEVVWAPSGLQGIQTYRKNTHSYATVVIDYDLPDIKGHEVAQQIRKINSSQDILFASGYRDPAYLTDMLESGIARTFLDKARAADKTRELILESLRLYHNRNRVVGADEHDPDRTETRAAQYGIIGRSRALAEIIEQVEKIRPLPVDVRIIGESGTGKELIAQALLPAGLKITEVPCPEFNSSENAFESELFGHVKGAFTGADSDKPGLLLQAHKNVLFLDEVHTLSIVNQQKFLRVLQERKFRKKGDARGTLIPVEFRVFSAAKPEIHQMVGDGRFLEDLYHRLGKVDIYIPPLRERTEDIEPLVRHFQDRYNRKFFPAGGQRQFRISTIREMEKYAWTGNVRELDGAVCTMMLKAQGDIINPANFDEYLRIAKPGPTAKQDRSMPDLANELIRDHIIKALKTSRSQQQAAERLGIHRSKLVRSMRSLGIQSEAYLVKA